MSGDFPQAGSLNDRLFKRYKEVVQRASNKGSVSTLPVGSTFESTISGQSFNSTALQNSNLGLSTRQFYQRDCNPDASHVRGANISSKNSIATSKTTSAPQFYHQHSNPDSTQIRASSVASSIDASSAITSVSQGCFKVPQIPKKLNYWPWIRKKLDLMSPVLREIEDKKSLQFIFRMFEQTVHSVRYPPFGQPVNPLVLIDYIAKTLKEDHYDGKVPKPICSGSSFISDQASTLEFSRNGPKDAASYVESLTNFGSRVERNGHPDAQDMVLPPANMSPSYIARPQLNNQQMEIPSTLGSRQNMDHQRARPINQSILQPTVLIENLRRNPGPTSQNVTETSCGNESSLNLFSDSAIAQRRDEAAARQNSVSSGHEISSKAKKKPPAKPKVNKSTVTRKKSNNQLSLILDERAADSIYKSRNKVSPTDELPTVSRRGRPLKPPVKYWNSKGNETMSNGSIFYKENTLLNDSMTLRNHKVVDKKKTPPLKGSLNNTPLTVVPENKIVKTVVKTQPRKKTASSDDKENSVVEKRKYERKSGKKSNDTAVLKQSSSKGRTNKKKEETTQIKEKAAKVPQKRKSKEFDTTASKKMKTKENSIEDTSDIDDLFGDSHFKKRMYHHIQTLSPTSGMMSAKKAVAGAASEKVTPPCKAFGDMINSSHISAVSSVRGAPNVKENGAMKRIIKKVEKEQNKPQPKQQKGKTKQKLPTQQDLEVEKILNDFVKVSTYTVNTPLSSGTLTCFRGMESESVSENSDMEDDDDLM